MYKIEVSDYHQLLLQFILNLEILSCLMYCLDVSIKSLYKRNRRQRFEATRNPFVLVYQGDKCL